MGYLALLGAVILSLSIGLCVSYETVQPGHEAVGVRFGNVTGKVLGPGLHVVSPLNNWDHYSNLFNSTLFEQVEVPASDQQTATMDATVQWRIKPGAAVELRQSTGDFDRVFEVHFVPVVRGALRDAGRATKQVEDFYREDKIKAYRDTATSRIREELDHLGIEVSDVIVRDVTLPKGITDAISAKKEREQEVEKERAELERVRLQMQQQVAKADANLEAAARDAKARVLGADAKAYEIEQVQQQLAQSPNYIELAKAEKWNGVLPQFVGQGVPLFDLGGKK